MSSKRTPLADEEVDELLSQAATMKLRYDFTCRTLLHTGLRASEFAHMTDAWVDWQNEVVRVPEEDGEWSPKTDAAVRSIPIGGEPRTVRVMREYFKRNEAVGVRRETVYRRVKRVAEETDIQRKVTPHVLRHTFGTIVAERSGGDVQLIRQLMGHADISSASPYLEYRDDVLNQKAQNIWGGQHGSP